MPVSPIGPVGFTPYLAPQVDAADATAVAGRISSSAATTAPDGSSFGDLLADGLDRLEGLQDHADQLSVQAATGDLSSIHDYTIAATEAAVTTQLTVAMRNKAVEAFNEIMRMQV